MYRFNFILPAFCLSLLSCNYKGNTNTTSQNTAINNKSNDYKNIEIVNFQKEYADSIVVKGIYYAYEPDWKSNLEFYLSGKLIYATDPKLEYQFNNYSFPTIINDDSSLYILVERDDRPMLNKMDVFKFSNNEIDTIFSIPLFNKNGKDIDNDGIVEYCGYLDFMEIISTENTTYNPIIVYELNKNLIRFDSSATIELNKKVYGEFHGFKQDYSILIDNNKINNSWP